MSPIITLMNLIDTHRIDESWVQSFKLGGCKKKKKITGLLILSDSLTDLISLLSVPRKIFSPRVILILGLLQVIFIIDPLSHRIDVPQSYVTVYLGWSIDRDQPVPIAALRSDRVKLLIK